MGNWKTDIRMNVGFDINLKGPIGTVLAQFDIVRIEAVWFIILIVEETKDSFF